MFYFGPVSNLRVSIFSPVDQLKDYVRRVLVTVGNEQTHEIMPIGPTGFPYFTYSRYPIVLHYRKEVIRSGEQLYISGQIRGEQPFFDVQGEFFHVGLELMPAVPWYLFHIPGERLVDTGLVFSQLQPSIADDFKKVNKNEKDPKAIAGSLQQILIDLLPPSNPPILYIEKALDMIYSRSGNLTVGEIIDALHISGRHFRRQFSKVIGIGAKQYCKIIQFNTVFEAIQTGNERMLYDLALKHGYYDHSHFINDFKVYLGNSPRQFLQSDYSFLKNYLGSGPPTVTDQGYL